MSPQIRAMRDALVIDLDNAVGLRQRFRAVQFDNSGVIFVDPEFGGARQHAFARHTRDHLNAQRHIHGGNSRPAVRGTANDRLMPVPARVYPRLHVVSARDRLDGFDPCRDGAGQQPARGFNSLAFRCLHRDQPLQRLRRNVEPVYEFADPVIRKLHAIP